VFISAQLVHVSCHCGRVSTAVHGADTFPYLGQQILWMRVARNVKGDGVWDAVTHKLPSDSEVCGAAVAILCNSVGHCYSLLKISYIIDVITVFYVFLFRSRFYVF